MEFKITSWNDNCGEYCINGVHAPYRENRVAVGINQEEYGRYVILIGESLSWLKAFDFDNKEPCSIKKQRLKFSVLMTDFTKFEHG